jgi:hypothetical protein
VNDEQAELLMKGTIGANSSTIPIMALSIEFQ